MELLINLYLYHIKKMCFEKIIYLNTMYMTLIIAQNIGIPLVALIFFLAILSQKYLIKAYLSAIAQLIDHILIFNCRVLISFN